MVDQLTIPARHVVGGVWEGAPVHSPRDELWGTVVRTDLGLAVWSPTEGDGSVHSLPDDWRVCLGDPRGGAGLAIQVACRLFDLDEVLILGPSVAHIVNTITIQAEQDGWWFSGMKDGEPTTRLRTISAYLALTDRLCLAVGRELEGQVARWERDPDGWWGLYSRPGGGEETWDSFNLPQFNRAEWLPAIEAALGTVAMP